MPRRNGGSSPFEDKMAIIFENTRFDPDLTDFHAIAETMAPLRVLLRL